MPANDGTSMEAIGESFFNIVPGSYSRTERLLLADWYTGDVGHLGSSSPSQDRYQLHPDALNLITGGFVWGILCKIAVLDTESLMGRKSWAGMMEQMVEESLTAPRGGGEALECASR